MSNNEIVILGRMLYDLEKCHENYFNRACLRTEVLLWKLTRSSTRSSNPKSSCTEDPQFPIQKAISSLLISREFFSLFFDTGG